MFNLAAMSVREMGWQARMRRSKRLDFFANFWCMPLLLDLFLAVIELTISEKMRTTIIPLLTTKIETRAAGISSLALI
jgi:hypothetical protein